MSIEAPLSRFKKGNIRIYAIALLLFGAYCAYDGYFSKKFIEDHSLTGKPDSTLVFNQKGGPILIGAALVFAFYYWAAKDKKIVADDTELKISGEDPIPYDKMEQIDKTNFAAKGYFILTYKDFKGRTTTKKFSDRAWDNLAAIMDHLVAKLTS